MPAITAVPIGDLSQGPQPLWLPRLQDRSPRKPAHFRGCLKFLKRGLQVPEAWPVQEGVTGFSAKEVWLPPRPISQAPFHAPIHPSENPQLCAQQPLRGLHAPRPVAGLGTGLQRGAHQLV